MTRLASAAARRDIRAMAGRRALLLPVAGLALLAAGWSAYWLVATRVADSAISRWMTREEGMGRRWTCHDQRIGGYPFRFELDCSAVTIEDSRGAQPIVVRAGAVRAVALAYQPNHVIAEVDGPATVTLPTGERVDAAWTMFRASTVVRSGRLDSHDSEIEGLKAVQRVGDGEQILVAAARLETHVRPTPSLSETAFDVAIDGKSVLTPQLDGVLGGADPGDLTLRATIMRADAIGRGRPIDNIERWRAAGGKAMISQLRLSRGRIVLDVVGELGLDDERKIVGRIEGSAAGLDQLLARGGGALSAVLNWRPRNAPPDARPKGLPIALTMKDGRVMMGPIRLGNLAPLY